MAASVTYDPKQATPGPPPAPGEPVWRAIKPQVGNTWQTGCYSDFGTPVSELRGGAGSWTFGVVHLVRLAKINGLGDFLWDSFLNHNCRWDGEGFIGARVGGTLAAFPGSASTVEKSFVGGIQITAIAVDPGTSYPSGDRFWVNGRPAYDGPGFAMGWENAVADPEPFYLGREGGSNRPTHDWFIGMFLHLGALTDEEMFILRKNIETAKKVTGVDTIGGGVVALDHVWDVRDAMTIGAASSPATWVSTGAVGGGLSVHRHGADLIDVVEFSAARGIR